MNNRKMIVIPALSKFENSLRIHGRKIKAAIFIPNKTVHLNSFLLQSSLCRLKFLDIIGQYNEKGFQRGVNGIKRLHDMCSKGQIDMVICYSNENVLDYENSLDNEDNSIKKYGTAFYCIKDCIIIKDNEIISLS
jgi:hypothetical protein